MITSFTILSSSKRLIVSILSRVVKYVLLKSTAKVEQVLFAKIDVLHELINQSGKFNEMVRAWFIMHVYKYGV